MMTAAVGVVPGARSVSTRPFFWLMASVFVVALGYGVVLPILPFFLERLLADLSRFSLSWHVGAVTAGSGLLASILSYRISLAGGAAQGAVLGNQSAASSLGQAIGAVVAGLGFAWHAIGE